jgi:hypothetical protein
MRGILVVLACALAVACKSKSDASTSPDPEAIKEQQALMARREALLQQRQELQTKSDALDVEIKDIQAKGGDASSKIKEKADLDTQIKSRSTDFNQLSTKLDAIQAQGDQSAALVARFDKLQLAEDKLAQAQADVAKREAEVAKKLDEIERLIKDLDGKCGAPAGPALVIQQAPAGGAHSHRDVDPLLAQARREMAKRGILGSDLPGAAQGLEAEANAAMAKNEWGTAYLAAAQLVAQVNAIKIDRPFIMSKYNRLNTRVTNAKLDPAVSQQLTAGMSEILQKYNDGDFAAANAKINALYALVR